MSCQHHRVTSGQSNSGQKQMHISKLFQYIQTQNKTYIHKHQTQIFEELVPFNITPVKRALDIQQLYTPLMKNKQQQKTTKTVCSFDEKRRRENKGKNKLSLWTRIECNAVVDLCYKAQITTNHNYTCALSRLNILILSPTNKNK